MNDICTEITHRGMGTEMAHRAYGSHAGAALQAVQAEAERLEELLSRYRPGSDISRLNAAAGMQSVALSAETRAILRRAVQFAELFHGLFDVTIGPLADLWDYKHAQAAPEPDHIRQALALVNYAELALDNTHGTALLRRPGQSVDLGGIAKGYASDRFMELFRSHGVTSAFSNIGGNVSTLGIKPDGTSWRVGIRHPRLDGLLGAVDVTNQAVVTSGDYERFFIGPDGRRYHHILSPSTGYPADAGLISVTIVADSAMTADALSTGVFVADMEQGIAAIRATPGAEAVLVDGQTAVFITEGLLGRFHVAPGVITRTI